MAQLKIKRPRRKNVDNDAAIRPGRAWGPNHFVWWIAITALTALTWGGAFRLRQILGDFLPLASWTPSANFSTTGRSHPGYGNPDSGAEPRTDDAEGRRCEETAPRESAATRAHQQLELTMMRSRQKELESELAQSDLRNSHLRHLLDQQSAALLAAQSRAHAGAAPNSARSGARSPAQGPAKARSHQGPKASPPRPLRADRPKVFTYGNDALITGTVRNPNLYDEVAQLEIELSRDGRRIGQRHITLDVPAADQAAYKITFAGARAEGTIVASARVL